MNRPRVQALLRLAETCKMLDHSRDVVALEAFHVVVAHLPGKVRVFRESLFNLNTHVSRRAEKKAVTNLLDQIAVPGPGQQQEQIADWHREHELPGQ